jgi:NAD(P)-dependent dehydrogenase (short-subunit alcohol dehydrogenase family)
MRTSFAIVVGGSGAIGGATVDALLAQGHSVIATRLTATGSPSDGGRTDVRWFTVDVRDSASLDELAANVGGFDCDLDAMIYTVGVPSTKRFVSATPMSEFSELLQVNALGFAATFGALAPLLRASRAAVVVVSSAAVATKSAGNGAYTASKAALEAVALTAAKEEAACGVRINVLEPSLVASPMAEKALAAKGIAVPAEHYASLPFGDALNAEDVGEAIVRLVYAPEWRLVSGQVIRMAANVD